MNRFFTAACLIACWSAASGQVRVWEATLTLPTYEEGLPDPNPPFDEYATTKFNYPYTLRENLTSRRAEHAWRAVYLENEYLKCSVLPDIGGHLYTCIDKISGQPLFYANPSIKKAQIGYRGAWAAFGIEFNFPVSHNWASMSPVDFAFKQYEDGSAAVTVGNIDRVYGMEWDVELILRPGSTVLQERVSLNNRSDVRHRFYWWNNAAVEVWDDSRICYPMRFSASHGFTEIDRWPVDSSGTDQSIIHNQTFGPVSRFVHGSREPFMGVWHPKTGTGVAHFAGYGDLPGKKIWSWGVDADGLDWRKALSDNNSAYAEVQAGLFRNQETYAFLEPRQTIHFSEYWMPVRELGGIARANLAGVLNLSRNGNSLIAAFNANHAIPGASIRILDGSSVLADDRADLAPQRTWKREVAMPDRARAYTFELRDANGTLLLRQTEGEYDWTPESEIQLGAQKNYRIPPADKRTEDDWVQLGAGVELNGKLLGALETYQQALARFPNSFALGKAAGRLDASLLRYDEAVRLLEPVQRRDTPDPEIAYYLGIAYDGLGRPREAVTAFETAQRLPSFHAAASLQLGELRAREGDFRGAAAHLEESLRVAPDDLRAAEELSAVLHALGDDQQANALARKWFERFPTSSFLREQLGKPDDAHLASDSGRVLNIAAEHMRLGLYPRALEVLSRQYPDVPADRSEPGGLRPRDHPLVAYFRGYCRGKLGQSGAGDYAAGSKQSTAYVFPAGAEALQVLRAASQANGQDATAHYLLGTHYFSRGLVDPAIDEWERARALDAKIPVLHASLGRALLGVQAEPRRALQVFREGIAADPKNIQIFLGLDQTLSLLGRPAAERVAAIEQYSDLPNMPTSLVYELAMNRSEAGDYDGAVALFRDRFFPREEGGANVRQVWIEVRLQQALALSRGGQCDAALVAARELSAEVPGLAFTRDGLSSILDSPRVNYLLGEMELRCGRAQQASVHLQRAAESSDPGQTVWAWAASKKLDRYDDAQWRDRLQSALAQAELNLESSSNTISWLYASALLEQALGQTQAAREKFDRVFLLPDRMLVYHLSRLRQASPFPN
jgi:tetratricopeptide (TPR) repeat protein